MNVTMYLSEHLFGNGLTLSQKLQFGLAEILRHRIDIFCVILLIITHPVEVRVSLLAILKDLALQILVACSGARKTLAPLRKTPCLISVDHPPCKSTATALKSCYDVRALQHDNLLRKFAEDFRCGNNIYESVTLESFHCGVVC